MNDFQAIVDRVEIEALRGEFTDAVMMRDHDRIASLFTPDGMWRMPSIPAEMTSQAEIRAWCALVPIFVDFLVQTLHPGTIALDGDTASGAPTSRRSGAAATAVRGCTSPSTTTATSAPRTAGSSRNASTRSDTRTPHL